MTNIAGYTATGRRLKGPASDIVEATRDDGEMLSAMLPRVPAHPAINEALDVVARFLEDPMVHDLVELVGRDRPGRVRHDTGPWAVADIIRILADGRRRSGRHGRCSVRKDSNEAASLASSVYPMVDLRPGGWFCARMAA